MRAVRKWVLWTVTVALLGCGRTELTSPGDEPAATRDAGSTAPSDAGLVDAGALDSGAPDSGGSGGGADDAGALDAGPSCSIGPSETVLARLAVTADNQRVVWVNGELVERTSNEWFQATVRQVLLWRHPSRENVIAVRATNLTSQGGLDRGLLLSLTLNQSVVATDQRWRQRGVNDGGWPSADLSWLQPGFDDTAWTLSVEQAANGSLPWGVVGVVSPEARWIWPYHSATFPKPEVEPVLFRRVVFVTLDGGLGFAPLPCP